MLSEHYAVTHATDECVFATFSYIRVYIITHTVYIHSLEKAYKMNHAKMLVVDNKCRRLHIDLRATKVYLYA